MAMQNTLGLPELLENIISHLPERDILCNAQRASRHWKTIIDSSPTIQKKIWLQPVRQPAISPLAFSEDDGNMMAESPIYPRTTLINPLLIGQDSESYNWLELSPELTIRMKPMGIYGKPTGCSCPNLRMPTPKVYEQIKSGQKSGIACVPSWRNMYLSQPPVTTVMLTIAYFYQAPVDGEYLFQVMIREKRGVTLGLVYDTLAATMPAYDESLEDPEASGAVTAHVGWLEWNEDEDDDETKDSEDGSSEEDSEDDSGGYDSSGDADSVAYDSEGNLLEDSSSLMGESSSEAYAYAEHESELGSDTGYDAAGNEELVETEVAEA
jgi:hypothetical protein